VRGGNTKSPRLRTTLRERQAAGTKLGGKSSGKKEKCGKLQKGCASLKSTTPKGESNGGEREPQKKPGARLGPRSPGRGNVTKKGKKEKG